MEFFIDNTVVNNFSCLATISLQIYDEMFEKLYYLDSNDMLNTKEADSVIKKIKLLKLKEKRVLDKIEDSYSYALYYDLFGYNALELMISDEEVLKKVYNRIGELLLNKTLEEEKEIANLYDEADDEDYEIIEEIEYDEKPYDKSIETRVWLELLQDIDFYTNDEDDVIKAKYILCFENPNVEDELSVVRYNQDNVLNMPDEDFIKVLDYSKDRYEEVLNNFYNENFNKNTLDFLEKVANENFSYDDIAATLTKIKFLLKKIDNDSLRDYVDKNFENDSTVVEATEENISFVAEFSNSLVNELNARSINLKQQEKEEENQIQLNPELMDKTFELLKTINNIYDIYRKLWYLELNNKKGSKEFIMEVELLKELCIKEKKQVSDMDVNEDNILDIMDFIDEAIKIITELDLITNSDDVNAKISFNDYYNSFPYLNKAELFKARFMNLFPNLDSFSQFIFLNSEVPTNIIRKYEIETINKFDQLIEMEDDKKELLEAKYENLFVSTNITNDFIKTEGDLSKADILDDGLLCELLEINIDEYEFDKAQILNGYASAIINNLSSIPRDVEYSDLEVARAKFQTFAFELIMEQLDEDSIDDIKENYQSFVSEDNSTIYKNLGKILQRKKQKTLINKISNKRH